MCDGYAATECMKKRRLKRRQKRWDYYLLRVALLLAMISTTVYVTIPDYPWGTPFWQVVCWDANGWLHEVFYIWTFFLVGIDLSYRFEKKTEEV